LCERIVLASFANFFHLRSSLTRFLLSGCSSPGLVWLPLQKPQFLGRPCFLSRCFSLLVSSTFPRSGLWNVGCRVLFQFSSRSLTSLPLPNDFLVSCRGSPVFGTVFPLFFLPPGLFSKAFRSSAPFLFSFRHLCLVRPRPPSFFFFGCFL